MPRKLWHASLSETAVDTHSTKHTRPNIDSKAVLLQRVPHKEAVNSTLQPFQLARQEGGVLAKGKEQAGQSKSCCVVCKPKAQVLQGITRRIEKGVSARNNSALLQS